MLGGIAPILLFTFFKKIPEIKDLQASQPIVADNDNSIQLPPIPLYLDENLTGILIDTENKSIDAETIVDTTTDGSTPKTTQKAVNSTVQITMTAKKDSAAMIILSAMMDIIYEKLTSKEYQVTYLHGAVTVFGGLLHSFNITQDSNTEICTISLTLVRNSNNTLPIKGIPVVGKITGTKPW